MRPNWEGNDCGVSPNPTNPIGWWVEEIEQPTRKSGTFSSMVSNNKCPFVEPNDHTTICSVTWHCCGPWGNNGSKIVDQWWMMTLNLAETWPTYVIVVLIGVFFFSFSQLFLKIFLVYNLYCKNKIFTLYTSF